MMHMDSHSCSVNWEVKMGDFSLCRVDCLRLLSANEMYSVEKRYIACDLLGNDGTADLTSLWKDRRQCISTPQESLKP